MPVITMAMGKGQTTPQQKKELVEKLTASASQITGTPAKTFTIFIDELNMDSIGVGGRTLDELKQDTTG
jgi:4-oxalocrotonate tautomerase